MPIWPLPAKSDPGYRRRIRVQSSDARSEMAALESVSSFFPETRVPIVGHLEELGMDASRARLYERFFGFSEIRLDPLGNLVDLMRGALGAVDLVTYQHRIRYLVHGMTIQLSPYGRSPLHVVKTEFGLDHATTFSISQHACASGLLAVDVCAKLLAADADGGDESDGLALVLVGEKAFTPVAQFTDAAVMGEGMAAVLINNRGASDRIVGYASRSYGEFTRAPFIEADLAEQFTASYSESLVDVVRAACEEAAISPRDLKLVLPHNVNQLSWRRAARSLGLPMDRIPLDAMGEYGHCFGADSFINYQRARELGQLHRGDHYVMTAVGLGATFAAMVFEH